MLCPASLVAVLAVVEPSAPGDEAGAEAAEAVEEPAVVLLSWRETADRDLVDAIEAHLHGHAVGVVEQSVATEAPEPQTMFTHADRIGTEQGAVGVFWIDDRRDGMLTLYLVRPGVRKVFVRHVEHDPEAREAGLEAVALITQATTTALVSGSPIDMEIIDLEPEPAPEKATPPKPEPEPAPVPVPEKKKQRGRARLALGYVGTSYAREIPWQSGLGLGAGWVWPFGLHAGLGYTAYQRVRAGSGSARIEVRRNPAEGFVGYSFPYKNLFFEAEAAVVLDYTVRAASVDGPGLSVQPDAGHLTVGALPRARLGVQVVWRLELFLALGVELWLSSVRYAVETPGREVVLEPRRVRAWTSAGLAIRI